MNSEKQLAIHGGQPIRDSYLPYGKQWLCDEDIVSVVRILEGPMITQGKTIDVFEQVIADYVGAKYAIAFCNGTAALHGACYAAGIGNDDEVLVPPVTFVASANAVLYAGGKPVFVDIDAQTYNINPELLEQVITPRTRAIIAVDFTGQPVDIRWIREVADRYNLIVIQDSAHSLGAYYDTKYLANEESHIGHSKNRMVGTTADMTMFSFHPVKHITTGEGGVIVTDSKELADKLRMFRSHGITSDRNLMTKDEGPWYYEMHELGYNYRMTDIQAALGISQMGRLQFFVDRRREYASIYNEAFKDVEGIIVPYQLTGTHSSWHLYVIRLQLEKFSATRRQIFGALRAENIGVHVHYIPVYLQPYYQQLGYRKGICPIAETCYEEFLTLPLYPKMLVGDLNDVICGVKKVLNEYSTKG